MPVKPLGQIIGNKRRCKEILRRSPVPSVGGIPKGRLEDLVVSSVEESASIILSVLSGEKGPARDISILNAGCVIAVAGLAGDIPEGISKAEKAIDSGAAKASLDKLVEISKSSDT